MISRTQWIIGATGIGATSLYASYVVWLHSLPTPVTFLACIVIAAIAGTFAITYLGYCEDQNNAKRQRHFKCDFATLQELCLLLAQLEQDATGYAPYSEEMKERLAVLRKHRPLFAESQQAEAFRCFCNAVEVGIECKKTALDEKTRQFIQAKCDKHCPVLKSALDDDYEKARP